jgi:hypothetical protein
VLSEPGHRALVAIVLGFNYMISPDLLRSIKTAARDGNAGFPDEEAKEIIFSACQEIYRDYPHLGTVSSQIERKAQELFQKSKFSSVVLEGLKAGIAQLCSDLQHAAEDYERINPKES